MPALQNICETCDYLTTQAGAHNSITRSINHSGLSVIFASVNHLAELVKLAPKTPHVKMIVSLDDLEPELKRVLTSWAGQHNIKIKTLNEGGQI